MKRLLPFFAIAVLLTGCSIGNLKSSALGDADSTPKPGDTVSVNYVGTLADGSVFDSSKTEGRTPLEFVIGSGSMIKWFEAAVVTMKTGEKKTVTLAPEDAYGPEYIEKTMPLADYKEVITQKVPKNVLTGLVEQSLPKVQAEQILGGSTVGTEKKLGVATVKITKVDGDNVTVSVNDPNAPFYGKEIKVGLTATAQDGSVVTVKTVTGDDVEVDIKPDQTVVSKTATEITVKTKNPQNLAGKALTFEIELLSITPAAVSPEETPAK